MRIFIDESGSFQIPDTPDEHAAAVVVGVVVPEVSEAALFGEFAKFTASLDPTERKDGEPTGSRLSRERRRRFCDLLAGVEGAFIIPTTADLSDLAGHGEGFPARLSKSLRDFVPKCVYQTMRDEVTLLSDQVHNLSPTLLLKLLLYAECIQECIHHAVVYCAEPPYRECWSRVDIVIDQVHKSPDSREKQVFDFMLLSWLTAWSKRRPLMLIDEIHTADHPFVKNFDTGTGIDMRKLIGNGMRWADSGMEPGIQVADIAANIVFGAVHDLKNHDNRLPDFLSLLRRCPLETRDGPGLVTLVPNGRQPQTDKYRGLILALEAKFPKRQWMYKGLRQPPPWALSKTSRDSDGRRVETSAGGSTR